MEIRDYNGEGDWTRTEIIRRYQAYVRRFQIENPRDLEPMTHNNGEVQWVYPVMDEVIAGIEDDDVACAEIGVEFIKEDIGFPFGAILKSNTARALRRCKTLTEKQKEEIRIRVVSMLCKGKVPREYVQYRKLLRAVGYRDFWPDIKNSRPRNHFARRAKRYFLQDIAKDQKTDLGKL